MIALYGGLGSIGRRYAAILEYYEIPFGIFDKGDYAPDWDVYTKAIVCTPTDTHIGVMKEIPAHIPVLCEKPISKFLGEIPKKDNTFMVCNYKYVVLKKQLPLPWTISYDYYNTGPDGKYWDCCQLLYLDPNAKIDTRSPRWNLNINGKWIRTRELENGYISMILDFAKGFYSHLWTMEDAIKMTRIVQDRIKG